MNIQKEKYFFLLIFSFSILVCLAQDTSRYAFNFPSDEFSLSKKQRKALDSLLLILEEPLNTFVYYIQGHTDSTGDRKYNLQLSEKRCESVRKLLLKKGVDSDKISFERFGYDIPVASNETETGRANNRRTTLTIVVDIPPPDWHIDPQLFEINPNTETSVKTKNSCKVVVPADAFVLPDVNQLPGKIELEIIEYNNPAYFIASGIPMSYEAAGKFFMYHSEEMLSVKAFYNSTPLELKNDVKITLNCREVDSLYVTGFYKFNLKENKWFEDNKSFKETPQENEEKKVETLANDKEVDSEKKSFEETVTKKDVPINLTEGSLSPEENETPLSENGIDFQKIEELKLDTGWYFKPELDTGSFYFVKIDTASKRVVPNCCAMPFFTALGLKLTEKPIDLSGLYHLEEGFKVNPRDHHYLKAVLDKSEERIGARKYYHIKIRTKKLFLRRKAIVKIRYDKELSPELNALRKVQWHYRFKDNAEDYRSFKSRKFNDVRIVYDPISKTATLKLEDNAKFTTIKLKPIDPDKSIEAKMKSYQRIITPKIMTIYSSFWNYNDYFFAKEEKGLSFLEWVTYFNANLNKLHVRYDSLSQNVYKIMKELNCNCVTPPPCIKCDSIPSDSSVKIRLRGSGPNRILIIGLGIYNYDVVIPVDNQLFIPTPSFIEQNGRKIYPKETFLILGGINGMIPFSTAKNMWLVKNYKNTLFIVDRSNRRYKIVFDADTDLTHLDSVFLLQNITKQTATLEGLEKELMSK